MKTFACIALLIALLGAVAFAATANHPDFAGSWKMDPARSESAHQDVPTGSSTLTIRQSATEITIETTRTEDNKPAAFHETLVFNLDGSERRNRGDAGAEVTAKARWDGASLVAETVRNVEESTVTTRYVYTLSPNRRDLTVDKTLTVQHGYMGRSAPTMGHGKDIFVRVSQ